MDATLPSTTDAHVSHLTSPQPAKERGLVIESLDAWRGFAALWVVLVHACLSTILTRYPELASSPLYQFPLYGALGVPIFFVISGFCITNAAAVLVGAPEGAVRYIRARFRRLYPPYAVMSVLAFGAAVAAGVAVHTHVLASSEMALANPLKQGWLYYLSALTMMQVPLNQTPILAPFWSLSYEASFYAIVLAALVAARSVGKVHVVAILHAVTAVSLLLFIIDPARAIFPLDMWPQFGIGVLLYDLLRNPGQRRPALIAFVFAIGLLAGCLLHPQFGWDGIGKPAISTQLATCVSTGLLIWLTVRSGADFLVLRLPPVRWLARIGVFSYSLYLSHFLVLGLVLQAVKHVHYTAHTFVIIFFAQAVVALFAGYLFFRLCEIHFISNKARLIHREATIAQPQGFA